MFRCRTCNASGGPAIRRIFIGTSGWVYPHWRGRFYPAGLPEKEWLGFYADRFPCVELNATFYRLPSSSTVHHWHEGTPERFRFAVKASRTITHFKRLNDTAESLRLLRDALEPLGRKKGPILYQLPPRWPADPGRLAAFLSALPRGESHVFEFREPSWYSAEIRTLLAEHGAGFCIHDHPNAPSLDWATAPFVYFRFHGSQKGPAGQYGSGELKRTADRLSRHLNEGRIVYAFFNNDAEAAAPANAEALTALLTRS